MRLLSHLRALLLGVSFLASSQRGLAQAESPPRLESPAPAPAGWHLRWNDGAQSVPPGYLLQFQENLGEGIWRVPSDVPLPLATNQWVDARRAGPSSFYRVSRVPLADRGRLISAELKAQVGLQELNVIFLLSGIPLTPKYVVRLYKVTYETISPWGEPTVATGALCLPEAVSGALPLLSYQHGTITQITNAPSSMDPRTEVLVGIAFATDGYAAVVPDYLGLGDSPGLHPYHHARSQATACVDLLRAARTACATNGFPLSGRLFLCGYSQGGHATLGLLRELELLHAGEFSVTACAPMAGAYDLAQTTTEYFLNEAAPPNPYYFLYLLASFQSVYRLAPSLADLLRPPYDTTLPPLMNGQASGEQINAAMPSRPTDILKPVYLEQFKSDPRHPLRLALAENSVYRWKPAAPLRFYHCGGDRDVPKANSVTAVAYIQSVGRTDVTLIDPVPAGDHGACVQPSMLDAKRWFDQWRGP